MGQTELTIVTKDGGIALTLTGSRVRMHMSDAARDEMRRDLREDADLKGGLIGRFARLVAEGTGELVARGIECTVADIESIAYERGSLVFIYRRKLAPSFEDVRVGKGWRAVPALRAFREADARAFVQAFDAHRQ